MSSSHFYSRKPRVCDIIAFSADNNSLAFNGFAACPSKKWRAVEWLPIISQSALHLVDTLTKQPIHSESSSLGLFWLQMHNFMMACPSIGGSPLAKRYDLAPCRQHNTAATGIIHSKSTQNFSLTGQGVIQWSDCWLNQMTIVYKMELLARFIRLFL